MYMYIHRQVIRSFRSYMYIQTEANQARSLRLEVGRDAVQKVGQAQN